jgi:hypothetical protein
VNIICTNFFAVVPSQILDGESNCDWKSSQVLTRCNLISLKTHEISRKLRCVPAIWGPVSDINVIAKEMSRDISLLFM